MPKVSLRGLPPDNSYVGPTPRPPQEDGTPADYWVLPERDRAVAIQPVRQIYRHDRCSRLTKVHIAIAETLAAQPDFYELLFCAECKQHYPAVEFVWRDDGLRVGS